MSEIKKTSKRRSTTFCQNRPSKLVKTVAVYIKEDGVWVVCKGKILKNWLCKYYHNGKTAIITDGSYRFYGEGYNEKQILDFVVSMNLQSLEYQKPKKKVVDLTPTMPDDAIFDDFIAPEWYGGPGNNAIRFRTRAVNNEGAITEILNGNP